MHHGNDVDVLHIEDNGAEGENRRLMKLKLKLKKGTEQLSGAIS